MSSAAILSINPSYTTTSNNTGTSTIKLSESWYSPRSIVQMDTAETPLAGASSARQNDDPDEVEASFDVGVEVFQDFLMTSSPMPSLRRVGEDPDVTPLVAARFRLLDRTASAPIQTSTCRKDAAEESKGKVERRSIFGAFWQSSSMRQKERFQMPARPASPGMVEASFPHQSSPMKAMSLRSREEYHATIDTLLPCMPAPLERLLNRSSGVYPLCEPKPILKRDDDDDRSPSVAGLKQTLQRLPLHPSASEDSSTETTCASTTASKAVHFDPRVVVTEVYDDCPRVWYSDRDLRKFQEETCSLAKAYLQMHPELIPLYSKPIYDPILKKARRKPLFGLQGLCSADVSLEDLQVKRILLVDPNDKILDLLCRSLQMIFPAAEMIRSGNGATALDLLKTRDIDIVVCREQLTPRHCAHGELDNSASLFARYQREEVNKWRNTLLISITSEMEAVGQRSIAGHGPTDFVWGLPPPKMDRVLQGKLKEALNKKKHNKTCNIAAPAMPP